jgi:hypothetical protein
MAAAVTPLRFRAGLLVITHTASLVTDFSDKGFLLNRLVRSGSQGPTITR